MLLLMMACEPVSIEVPTPEDTHTETSAPEELWGASVYEPFRLLQVDVELDPDDWEVARNQSRNILDLLAGEDCLAEPFESPYTWFDARVSIDGEDFDEVRVRKKGLLGSVEPGRPSLKLRLDKTETDANFEGVSRLTLNNNRQDASRLKTCMGYEILARSGVAAPRCSLAHVTVNGEDLGLYSNVEPIREPLLARNFGGDGTNDLFEITLSDFRPDWVGSFQDKTGDSDRAILSEVTDALDLDDDDFLVRIEELVNVEQFMEFWAMEVILGHWDGYNGNTNNTWVYVDDDGRLNFIPWGIDAILVGEYPFGEHRPASVVAASALGARFYGIDSSREQYQATLQRLLDEVWDEDALQDHLDGLVDVGGSLAKKDNPAYTDVLGFMEDFVASRQDNIEAELATDPTWDEPLRANPCLKDVGSFEVAFSTTWGSYGTLPTWSTGGGELTLSLQGTDYPLTHLTSLVGEYDEGQTVLLVGGTMEDGGHVALYVVGPTTAFDEPGVKGADWSELNSYILADFDGDLADWQTWAWIGGDLNLTESSTVQGTPVVGSGTFTVWGG
jgi:spore coat protein H